MKKWLKKLWREVREWFEEATGWNALDLGDFDLSGTAGQGSDCNPPDLPGAPAVPDNPSSPADASGVVPEGSSSVPVGDSAGEEPSPDDIDFAGLQWSYGGFRGGSATISGRARIRGLKVTRNGMRYSWASGGCEDLGASGPHDAACLACLFCHVRDQWLGGKFDWISTDRRTRDFENIESGYGGWEPEAFRDADAYAFVIVSKDGKRRTNVIMQKGRN